jgi:hypothetical protein
MAVDPARHFEASEREHCREHVHEADLLVDATPRRSSIGAEMINGTWRA